MDKLLEEFYVNFQVYFYGTIKFFHPFLLDYRKYRVYRSFQWHQLFDLSVKTIR